MKFKDIIKDETNNFLLNKIEWLNNDNSITENTKITYYRLFNQTKDIEESKGKDINKFTGNEVEEVVKSYITNSEQTKRSLYSAISSYLNWCVDNDIISYNVCDTIINPKELYQVNETIVREQYMNLDEFYKWLDNLDGDNVQKMSIILIRYGVPVKLTPKVRFDDVNEDTMTLDILDGDKVLMLPIDEEFIRRVKLCYNCDSNYNDKEYFNLGYILKSTKKKPLSTSSVYTMILNICERSNIQRVDISLLGKSRQLDLIFEVVKKNGEIYTEDVSSILNTLGISNSPTQITVLGRLLSIFNVEIKSRRTGKEILVVNSDGEIFGEYESVSACAKDLSNKIASISRSTILRHIRLDTDFYGLKFIKED